MPSKNESPQDNAAEEENGFHEPKLVRTRLPIVQPRIARQGADRGSHGRVAQNLRMGKIAHVRSAKGHPRKDAAEGRAARVPIVLAGEGVRSWFGSSGTSLAWNNFDEL